MNLSFLLVVASSLLASAVPSPWTTRPGRGAYKRNAEAFHLRPGDPIYTLSKREALPEPKPMPEAEPKAEPFHLRPGDPIYTWVKREARPMPEPKAWTARPGRGAY